MSQPLVVWKPYKPRTLNRKGMEGELHAAMFKVGRAIKADFERTTRTWETKVKFEVTQQTKPGGPEVMVGTDNQIYRYVDEGTREHVILPKKPGGVLAFAEGYTRKTRVGVIGSWPGGPRGATVFSKGVLHPGFPGRKFTKVLQKRWLPKFRKLMTAAWKRVARRSGHSMK